MLALRDVMKSRPVRAMKALLMRAADARATLVEARGKAPPSHVEKVRGLDGAVSIARDGFGVPGIFAGSRADLAFGMGWACAEDRLFQMELIRRAMRGELAETFGDRPVDERAMTKLMAGRTFFDLDAFTRAIGFRGAAESSYQVTSGEGRSFVDAYALGVNAYLDSGRRPLEMLLLDLEPKPWTGVDCLLVAKATAFQLSFSYRFALAHALVRAAVDERRTEALRPVAHPLTASRAHSSSSSRQGAREGTRELEPLIATTEVLRAVLGADGIHLGSNAFAVAPHRSSTRRAIVASDPHMPLTAPSVFWESRLQGGGLDVRGFSVPGFPAIAIGQNAHGAWGATAGWGDDAQLYREDLAKLRAEGRLETHRETIAVRGDAPRSFERVVTPRGPVVSHVIGGDVLSATNGRGDHALVLRWSGQDPSADVDAALSMMRARSFDELREALADHGGPTLNFVWADDEGHIGWQFAGKVPQRRGNVEAGACVVSGLDIVDGEDPRGAWQGYVPFHELPHVFDPPDGVIVSANARPCDDRYPHFLGELFEPPFRMARIHALLDAHGTVGVAEIASIQRDVRSAWGVQMRDALLRGLDDEALSLPPRRGRDVVRLSRAWDGRADEKSLGALSTHMLIEAVLRHLFLEELGDDAFDRYFEIMNASALPLLSIVGDDESAWMEGRDRTALVRDAAAMAEGRLRRALGDDPTRWTWGRRHTLTFRHALDGALSEGSLVGPGLRAVASPGPYPARGDGTTVCMGEHDLRGGAFEVRVAPALRAIMFAGKPREGRVVLPPGQSGETTSSHYRDQVAMYLAGDTRAASWDETDFVGKRLRLTPG